MFDVDILWYLTLRVTSPKVTLKRKQMGENRIYIVTVNLIKAEIAYKSLGSIFKRLHTKYTVLNL